jgi:hypothetical protein
MPRDEMIPRWEKGMCCVPLELADVWTYIADSACRDYSPLYDRICRTVAASDDVLALIREAPPSGHQPTVMLAAVHYLLLGETDHALAAVYDGTSDADVGPLFVDFCLAHRAELLHLLATRHTNTNEVGRSAVLGPALTYVAARLGTPIAVVDVGCSAGLNLYCDHYLLDYGHAGTTGPRDASVQIACEVVGAPAPIAAQLPAISARMGIDQDPVDVSDDDQVRWQLACVWPDTGRLPRTRKALEEVRRAPPQIVRGDAVDTVGDVLSGLPSGSTAVVTTTWALAYLSKERRLKFREKLAKASRKRPVAWISGESAGVVDVFDGIAAPSDAKGTEASLLGLVVFEDGNVEPELLGFVHPHGNWIDWRA